MEEPVRVEGRSVEEQFEPERVAAEVLAQAYQRLLASKDAAGPSRPAAQGAAAGNVAAALNMEVTA